MSKFGRYHAPDPPSALLSFHFHDGTSALKTVDHEPKVAVLDQEDLLEQGIDVSTFIPGAQAGIDELGSCTANAFVAHSSTILDEPHWLTFTSASSYTDTVGAEKGAIRFYFQETHQTGDPAQEWPPTDCGSSGPYIYSEATRQGLVRSQALAHGADNIVSLLQRNSILMGSPWLNAWMEPDTNGFVDGNGSHATFEAQLAQGIAGGHETCLSAIEKLALYPTGLVDPFHTVVRDRNSWTGGWGDHGCCRFHLSTLIALGGQADFRQLRK